MCMLGKCIWNASRLSLLLLCNGLHGLIWEAEFLEWCLQKIHKTLLQDLGWSLRLYKLCIIWQKAICQCMNIQMLMSWCKEVSTFNILCNFMQPFYTLYSYNYDKHFNLPSSFGNKLTELWLGEFLNSLKAEYDELLMNMKYFYDVSATGSLEDFSFLGMPAKKEMKNLSLSLSFYF